MARTAGSQMVRGRRLLTGGERVPRPRSVPIGLLVAIDVG